MRVNLIFMNISDYRFFTEDVKSGDPLVEGRAYMKLFGNIQREENEDGEIVEHLTPGRMKRVMYRVIPKFFQHDFLEVYKVVSNKFFMYLREMPDETFQNVNNTDNWLWTVFKNFLLTKENEIKMELGGNDSPLPVNDKIGQGDVIADSVNDYLAIMEAGGPRGEYKARLIKFLVLEGISARQFLEEENEYRKECGIAPLPNEAAVNRDKSHAVIALINLAVDEVRNIRKKAFIELKECGKMEVIAGDNIGLMEDYCLRNGHLPMNMMPLVKKMFDEYNKIIKERSEELKRYYKDYKWLFNKYDEWRIGNPAGHLSKYEEKALRFYFENGTILNRELFSSAILKLGKKNEVIAGKMERSKKMNPMHEELLCYEDTPDIIESYFLESYKECMKAKAAEEDEKLVKKHKCMGEQLDGENMALAF